MLTDIQFNLRERCDLGISSKVILGVSGGPDSLCLLHLLWKLGMPVVVAHLDHQLRPESAEDAGFVAHFAAELGLPFSLGREDVQALADRGSVSIEEAARTARYSFLFAEAERLGAEAVAVAHTADDQIETILMHLLRGAGLAGLRGMSYRSLPTQWNNRIPLVRPLLGSWRSQVMAYLDSNHLVPLQDSSNQDVRFYRNAIRHRVLPFLEQGQPRLRERLWQMTKTLSDDYTIVEGVVELGSPGKFNSSRRWVFGLQSPEISNSANRGPARPGAMVDQPFTPWFRRYRFFGCRACHNFR